MWESITGYMLLKLSLWDGVVKYPGCDVIYLKLCVDVCRPPPPSGYKNYMLLVQQKAHLTTIFGLKEISVIITCVLLM